MAKNNSLIARIQREKANLIRQGLISTSKKGAKQKSKKLYVNLKVKTNKVPRQIPRFNKNNI